MTSNDERPETGAVGPVSPGRNDPLLGRRELLIATAAAAALFSIMELAGPLGAQVAFAEPIWHHPFPSYVPVVSGFGPREPPPGGSAYHEGLDFSNASGGAGAAGKPVYPIAQGTVVPPGAFTNGFGPNVVLVQHDPVWVSLYGHLASNSVQVGDVVGPSASIGTVGGLPSFPPHLHLGLRQSGTFIDPSSRVLYPAPLALTNAPPTPEENTMIQPIPSRVIRDATTGDTAYMHPYGIELLNYSTTMTTDSDFNGAALTALQPLIPNSNPPRYWYVVGHDQFTWEVQRHNNLLAAQSAYIKAVVLDALHQA